METKKSVCNEKGNYEEGKERIMSMNMINIYYVQKCQKRKNTLYI